MSRFAEIAFALGAPPHALEQLVLPVLVPAVVKARGTQDAARLEAQLRQMLQSSDSRPSG